LTDRKKPGVAFWATVVVVVVLGAYPLSFGPWCWVCSRVSLPSVVHEATSFFYSPILRAWFPDADDQGWLDGWDGQGRICDVINWYANLGARGKVTVGAFNGSVCLVTYSSAP
jgi:hypothetical protein